MKRWEKNTAATLTGASGHPLQTLWGLILAQMSTAGWLTTVIVRIKAQHISCTCWAAWNMPVKEWSEIMKKQCNGTSWPQRESMFMPIIALPKCIMLVKELSKTIAKPKAGIERRLTVGINTPTTRSERCMTLVPAQNKTTRKPPGGTFARIRKMSLMHSTVWRSYVKREKALIRTKKVQNCFTRKHWKDFLNRKSSSRMLLQSLELHRCTYMAPA